MNERMTSSTYIKHTKQKIITPKEMSYEDALVLRLERPAADLVVLSVPLRDLVGVTTVAVVAPFLVFGNISLADLLEDCRPGLARVGCAFFGRGLDDLLVFAEAVVLVVADSAEGVVSFVSSSVASSGLVVPADSSDLSLTAIS